jgi:hypothetical protein
MLSLKQIFLCITLLFLTDGGVGALPLGPPVREPGVDAVQKSSLKEHQNSLRMPNLMDESWVGVSSTIDEGIRKDKEANKEKEVDGDEDSAGSDGGVGAGGGHFLV